jgi:DNA-binding response OmpR family regulator
MGALLLQPIPIPITKPRLLLVSDSAERLQALRSCVAAADFEIYFASSLRELRRACRLPHDLVALDAAPSRVIKMLSLIRGSEGHTEIPVLVEYTRISNEQRLAGVLSSYRAMPCNRIELHTLLSRYDETTDRTPSRREML